MMIYDQTRATLPGQIGPNPLDEDTHSEIGCRKKLKMDRRPPKPCDESAHVKFPALQNGESLANHRHVSFVKIAERRRNGSARHPRANQFSGILSLLHRYLRDTW